MNASHTPSGPQDIRDAFFDALYALAKKDRNVIFLTADMGAFSLGKFKKDLRKQYINMGVAEQNMISVAAGLTLGGKNVFVYGIAPFVTLRCYEQIKVDLGEMRLPVTIVGAGPGIAYANDGSTHHALQDISVMRAIPHMVIFSPSESRMADAMARMSYKNKNPVYVRLDKGKWPQLYSETEDFSAGLKLLKKGRDVLIAASGIMIHRALDVAKQLSDLSLDAGVVDIYRVKPLNEDVLLSILNTTKNLVTLEEHSLAGGLGSAIGELILDKRVDVPVKRIGIADQNGVKHGDRDWTCAAHGLDTACIAKTVCAWFKKT